MSEFRGVDFFELDDLLNDEERAIRDTLLYYEVRLQRIDRGLRRLAAMGQEVTAYELWKALFPADTSAWETHSHLLMVVSALDCLEEDGLLVTARRDDGSVDATLTIFGRETAVSLEASEFAFS